MVMVMASEPCTDLHPYHSLVVMQEIGGMFVLLVGVAMSLSMSGAFSWLNCMVSVFLPC